MSIETRVEIDAERCMGSGNCLFWADGVFDLGADGLATVVGDPTSAPDRVGLAAEHCPTQAITVYG